MISATIAGFFTSLSLILAIGAQNAFVLRQGLLNQHVFMLCLFCGLSDAILIAAGVAGFGALVNAAPWLPTAMAFGGAVFLVFYGATRVVAAWRGIYDFDTEKAGKTVWATLGIAAALTWLNPHVYLDTLGLIGAISTQYQDPTSKWGFGIAAVSASFLFFFSLGYGARLLAPYMISPRTWQILDIGIALVMFVIAGGLIISIF